MSVQDDDWTDPLECAVDGVDLRTAAIGWRAIGTASETLFVCDFHSDADVRDAVHAAEEPDSIYAEHGDVA